MSKSSFSHVPANQISHTRTNFCDQISNVLHHVTDGVLNVIYFRSSMLLGKQGASSQGQKSSDKTEIKTHA